MFPIDSVISHYDRFADVLYLSNYKGAGLSVSARGLIFKYAYDPAFCKQDQVFLPRTLIGIHLLDASTGLDQEQLLEIQLATACSPRSIINRFALEMNKHGLLPPEIDNV